jgi:hypothetical protein
MPLLILLLLCLPLSAAQIPDRDPPAKPTVFVATVAGQHPRLLWTADELTALRARAQGPGAAHLKQCAAYCMDPSKDKKWQSDDTEAQRQAVWRAPSVLLHGLLTGDQRSLAQAKAFLDTFTAEDHWQSKGEIDCGMGAANIMLGAALLFDGLHDQLAAPERERVRRKLLLHARRLYYLGHLNQAGGIGYWQQDPQNNHRWHRLAGLVACALAAYEESDPESHWIMARAAEELAFVARWLPEDGSFHDSPSYMVFGGIYGLLAFDMADRCLGTSSLQLPFWRNQPRYRLHTLLPGLTDAFQLGDGGGLGFFNGYFLRAAGLHQELDLLAGLRAFKAAAPKAFEYGWQNLLFDPLDLDGGGLTALPSAALFPDLGVVSMRDDWSAGASAALFACGPYGGYALNRYRNDTDFHYINVAHDHPDANSFQIFAQGAMLATDDSYPLIHRLSAAHNTLTVNGAGQRMEGPGYLQPYKTGNKDMSNVAVLLSYQASDEIVACEGEAGRSYEGLSHFRRSFVFVRGRYILVIDDISAEGKPADLTWNLHSPAISTEGEGRFTLSAGSARCPLQIVASTPSSARIERDLSDNHKKEYDRGQALRLDHPQQQRLRLVALFTPWAGRSAELGQVDFTAKGLSFTVTAEGATTRWTCTFPKDSRQPSELRAEEGRTEMFRLGAQDRVPRPFFDKP